MSEKTSKLVVVTGGTKGIGRSIIHKFAEQGFSIATCARNRADLEQLKQAVEKRYGVTVIIQQADVSKKEEVKGFVDFVQGEEMPVAVLVNNAGRFVPGQAHTEEDGVLESQIETNLYSAYRMSRGFIPGMKKEGVGHVFNICSTASITAYTNGGSYCISKFAMYGMSKVLREELKDSGVKVTSVLPGATFTASWEGVDLPEDRFMKPEDVAESVFAAYSLSSQTVVEDLVIRPQLGDL